MTTSNLKQRTIIKEGITVYGVSSHHYVIPMVIKLIEVVNGGEYSVVHVEALNPSNEFEKRYIELVFNDLLLMDGEINRHSVFTIESEAKAYALKSLQKDEDELLRKLDALKKHKGELQK